MDPLLCSLFQPFVHVLAKLDELCTLNDFVRGNEDKMSRSYDHQ